MLRDLYMPPHTHGAYALEYDGHMVDMIHIETQTHDIFMCIRHALSTMFCANRLPVGCRKREIVALFDTHLGSC